MLDTCPRRTISSICHLKAGATTDEMTPETAIKWAEHETKLVIRKWESLSCGVLALGGGSDRAVAAAVELED
jgi:hypothetical protein